MKFKLFTMALAVASLTVTAEAKKKNGNAAAQRARNQEIQKKKAAEQAARDKRHDAISGLLKNKDKNSDGSLTKEEYLGGEADATAAGKRFDQFNKNKDRYLSKGEIESLLGL